MTPNLVILSHATYGATPAATYGFMTRGYKPPAQDRSVSVDTVHNQNGKFKWVFDNGPGFSKWEPFEVLCETAFQNILGANAATQYARLLEMWNHPGTLGMKTPDGTYNVHWAENPIERAFRAFPVNVGDTMEWAVSVQFEEA